ncbi:MAG: ArsR/SmtB family transcription factor [Hyphomicrobiales bacterium]
MDSFTGVLSAVSDPTRRSIIARLCDGPARVSEIAAPYPMSLNAVSKHLKVLERAGLVRRSRRGRDHILALDAKPLREVARWALSYERFWNAKLDRLEEFFATRSKAP